MTTSKIEISETYEHLKMTKGLVFRSFDSFGRFALDCGLDSVTMLIAMVKLTRNCIMIIIFRTSRFKRCQSLRLPDV